MKYKDQSADTAELASRLKHELKKHDLKTTEMVAYLQNEIHQKDAEMDKLRKANYSLQLAADNHAQSMQSTVQSMSAEHMANFSAMECSLRAEIERLGRELASLRYLKQNGEQMENALFVAKATMETQAKKFKLAMDQLESKYIVDTQRIRENAEREIAVLKDRAREFAEQELDAESRSLRMENKKYEKDLAFHCKATNVLHKENEQLAERTKSLRRDIALLQQTQMEQSKQCVAYKQRVQQLSGHKQRLEQRLSESTQEWDSIRQQMSKNFDSELQALKRQNGTLRADNKAMRSELNSFKHYSQTLIAQRTEVEQFLHEALQEVKQTARQRLQEQYQRELHEYSDSMRNLGLNAESVPDQQIGKDEIGISPPTKPHQQCIKLEQLSVQQREHVLKVLISKINAAQNAQPQSSVLKHQIDSQKKATPTQSDNGNDYNKTFLTQKQVHQQP